MSWNDDYYSKLAVRKNLRARSYFKLEAIDKKFNIIKKGQKILDLGTAPGSWIIYIIQKTEGDAELHGIDLKPIKPIKAPSFHFYQKDIFDIDSDFFDNPFDMILSDMAPDTSGSQNLDSMRSAELVEKTIHLSLKWLHTNGSMVIKYLQGPDFEELRTSMRKSFSVVRQYKPPASRKKSSEIFFFLKNKISPSPTV